MPVTRPGGFTLVELLVTVACLALVCILGFQKYLLDRESARDQTLLANLDLINTALSRYHTDHDQYPLFLLGGDVAGWRRWHATYDESTPDPAVAQNAWLHDPLIAGGYLTSYPENPFATDGGFAVRQLTSREGQSADPRFGLTGALMGNGLDDPRIFKVNAHPEGGRIATCRTQLASQLALVEVEPYGFGGRRYTHADGRHSPASTWWPGHFMYRSVFLRVSSRKDCYWWPRPNLPASWFTPDRSFVGSYLLGAYGDYNDSGLDIIRFEATDPLGNALYYRTPFYGWPYNTSAGRGVYRLGANGNRVAGIDVGLPEVFGGGSAWAGPVMPYNSIPGGTDRGPIQFGAPDGIPDGIIFFVTGPGAIEESGAEAL